MRNCPQCGKQTAGLSPLLNGRWGCEDCYLGETGWFFSDGPVYKIDHCPRGHRLVVEHSPRVGWVCCPKCQALGQVPTASILDLEAARQQAYLERAQQIDASERALVDKRQMSFLNELKKEAA
jgi:hypothetical protein